MIELNKIYNESNLDTMARMPNGLVDLTVTSPPYDGLRKYNGYSFPFEEIAMELFRVTKQGGIVVWNVGDSTKNGTESLTSFRQALFFVDVCGFNMHDTMIYKKENFIPLTHNRYEQEFEYMFVLSKGRPNTFNPIKAKTKGGGTSANFARKGYGFKEGAFRRRDENVEVKDEKIIGNVWMYSTGNSGVNHPAVMPEKMAADHIYSWSKEGDLVYDPFMGSGTTAKAAHLQKRNWIGSETSSEYVVVANNRLYPHLTQVNLF